MDIVFECECGNDVSQRTADVQYTNVRAECPACDAVYVVTVSQIVDGDGRPT